MVPLKASIRFKLAAALCVPILLVIVIGLSGVVQLQRVHQMTEAVRETALPKEQALVTIERALSLRGILARRVLETTDFRQLAEMMSAMRRYDGEIDEARHALLAAEQGEADILVIEDFGRHLDLYRKSFAEVQAMSEQGRLWEAERLFEVETVGEYVSALANVATLRERLRQEIGRLEARAQAVFNQSSALTWSGIALALAVGLITLGWLSRNFSSPILQVSQAMQALTNGKGQGDLPEISDRDDEIGILVAAAHAYRDSVAQRALLSEMAEVERDRLRAAIGHMPVGLCMLDAKGRMVVCNQAFQSIYGMSEEETRPGTSYLKIVRMLAERREPNRKPAREFLRGVVADLKRDELISRRWSFADGQYVKVLVQPMKHGWVTMHEDVTERLTVEDRIRHMARHDALTGLPNRTVFAERIEDALEDGPERAKAAVMILDLDRFKSVNDTLGHPIGDQLLRAVAQRLRQVVPERDVIARMGGDEFAIVLEADGIRDVAEGIAARLIDTVSKPYEIGGHAVRIGVTIGIALVGKDGHDADELLKNADLALYDAKASGRGIFRFFDHELDMNAQRRRRLELDLRTAIAEGQIVPYFQPIVAVHTGKVAGFEALARWEHPERGVLFPDEFIPVAEDTGLIMELGESILAQACRAAVNWPVRVRLSVNLSPRQFASEALAERIADIIGEAGFDPRRLDLEITESVLLNDTEETIATMHQLRNLGAAIVIDDFGIGYSSLSYLLRFPFDKLKLDGSFIRTLESHGSAHAIMRSVAVLGSSLCVRTTAEGVENRRQFHALRLEGITEAQGFLFGKAVPFAETEAIITAIENAGLSAA